MFKIKLLHYRQLCLKELLIIIFIRSYNIVSVQINFKTKYNNSFSILGKKKKIFSFQQQNIVVLAKELKNYFNELNYIKIFFLFQVLQAKTKSQANNFLQTLLTNLRLTVFEKSGLVKILLSKCFQTINKLIYLGG